MAGRGRFWCGAVSKNSPSTPTISVTLPPGKTRWRRLSGHSDKRLQRVFPGGSVTEIVGVLGLFFDTAPHQKRPRPAILLGEPHQGPVIEPFALAAETG